MDNQKELSQNQFEGERRWADKILLAIKNCCLEDKFLIEMGPVV